MCGRFTLKTTPETLTETFPGFTMPDELDSPLQHCTPSQGGRCRTEQRWE